jgi:hypothetical protein
MDSPTELRTTQLRQTQLRKGLRRGLNFERPTSKVTQFRIRFNFESELRTSITFEVFINI